MWRPKTGWRQEFESGDAQIPLALQLPNTCTLYQSSDRHYHPKKRKGDGKHRCMFKSSWFVASKQIAELHGNHIVQCSSKQDFVILNIEHPSVVKLLARRALDWNDADSFSPITVKEDGVSHERVIRHTSFIENKSLTTAITRYMRHPENIQLFIKELKLKGAHTIHGIGNVRPMMACEPPSKREHARIVKGSPIPTSNLQHQTSMGPVPLSTVMQFSEILLFSPNQVVDTKSAKSYANTSPDALAHAQRRACARTNVQRQRQMALAKHQHMRRVRAQRKRQTATIRRRTQTLPLII